MNGQLFPYTKFGKLRIEPGVPIYECNKRCKCGPNCANRVVQKGRKVKLCIYKTDNGMGWGVKTLENIRKGTFVVEYVGEVIKEKEAEERGKKYGKIKFENLRITPEILKKFRPKNSSNEMNQFHGIFFGYFPFSESKILIFMENIKKFFS